jgi:hypothetical protein
MMVPEVITRRCLTLADYEELPDDQDYEIIDGVLYLAPSARTVTECIMQPSGRYQERIHGPDGTFRPAIFPDLEIDLARIFR